MPHRLVAGVAPIPSPSSPRCHPPSPGGAHIAADADLDEEYLEWVHCMDDLGECNKLCAEALGRVVDACPGSSQLLGSSGSRAEQLMPFLRA